MKQNSDSNSDSDELVSGAGFNILAGYIFGQNDEQQSMKMTTPVFTTRRKSSDSDSDSETAMQVINSKE